MSDLSSVRSLGDVVRRHGAERADALKPGRSGDPVSIIKSTRERIAAYKTPKSVDFIEALTRNPSGKILKRELREPYWAGRERRVN